MTLFNDFLKTIMDEKYFQNPVHGEYICSILKDLLRKNPKLVPQMMELNVMKGLEILLEKDFHINLSK